jgi:hypothetical protein
LAIFCCAQAIFGLLGLLDDLVIFLLLSIYISTVFRLAVGTFSTFC